jgi:hypothetical protein
MISRIGLALPLTGALLVSLGWASVARTCCPAPPPGKPVVNADQTVILLWDAATQTEHFIRKASFTSAADDFGFLVPTPSLPELAESGNEAFPFLLKLTEPERKKVPLPSSTGCSCSKTPMPKADAQAGVSVRLEKEVAGFHAVVLEARSADALVAWLKERGYAFSPAVQAWAKPYVEAGWMITALKVAKDGKEKKDLAAAALRLTFHTDRPLFPYREPDSGDAAKSLGAHRRLLRIYFLADARYRGKLTCEVPWTGKAAWANRLKADDRRKVLELLQLPAATGPAEWWLTEFEDHWPYRVAPDDVYFARDPDQSTLARDPIIEYVAAPGPVDVTACAALAVVVLPPVLRRALGRFDRRWPARGKAVQLLAGPRLP